MSRILVGQCALAAVLLAGPAQADEPKADAVGRLRAAVADMRDSFTHIRQVVERAKADRNPVALTCAWNLQEKAAADIDAARAAVKAAREGNASDGQVAATLAAARDSSTIEAESHQCLTENDAIPAPVNATKAPRSDASLFPQPPPPVWAVNAVR